MASATEVYALSVAGIVFAIGRAPLGVITVGSRRTTLVGVAVFLVQLVLHVATVALSIDDVNDSGSRAQFPPSSTAVLAVTGTAFFVVLCWELFLLQLVIFSNPLKTPTRANTTGRDDSKPRLIVLILTGVVFASIAAPLSVSYANHTPFLSDVADNPLDGRVPSSQSLQSVSIAVASIAAVVAAVLLVAVVLSARSGEWMRQPHRDESRAPLDLFQVVILIPVVLFTIMYAFTIVSAVADSESIYRESNTLLYTLLVAAPIAASSAFTSLLFFLQLSSEARN